MSNRVATPEPIEAPPALHESSASAEAGPTDPSARILSDRDVLITVLDTSNHLDMQRADALTTLSRQLTVPDRRFDFTGMPTKKVAELFVAIQGLAGRLANSDELVKQINTTLGQRIKAMTSGPGIADIDFEALKFLAKAFKDPSREGREALTTACRGAMPALQEKLMLQLVGPMVQGAEAKSPSAVSSAVEAAKLAHDILIDLDPPDPALNDADKRSALQALMTDALKSLSTTKSTELHLVFLGKSVTFGDGAADLKDVKNDVSVAVRRRVDSTNNAKNRETLNLQLFRDAVGYAVKPKPMRANGGIAQELFGVDGNALPPESAIRGTSKASHDYFAFLSAFQLIEALTSMDQQQAKQLAWPLQEIVRKNGMGERVGARKELYTFDLESLKLLPAEQRPAAFCALLEPARIQAQERLVSEVTVKRMAKKTDAISRRNLEKRKAQGVKGDTSEALTKITAYEAIKAAKAAAEAAEAAEKAAKEVAANTGNPVDASSQ